MNRITFIIIAFVFLLSLFTFHLYAQLPTTEWIRTYPHNNDFQAGSYALALDDSGNVYISGFTDDNNPVMNGYCTIKYSSTGTLLWVANYFGIYTGGRYARAIALDKFSNVYVTGYSYETGQISDYCTVKYNSNGVQQWIRNYNGQVSGRDEVDKISVDGAGNIYVSGSSRTSTGFVITTIKFFLLFCTNLIFL